MLGPGDPGRLGTPIYVFTVESPQPVGARHTSCTHLLWKTRDPSREDTHLYLVTFETSQPELGRRTHLLSYLRNSRPTGQGTVHVNSYCGNPANWAGKAQTFA
jgi:hypothetical protein